MTKLLEQALEAVRRLPPDSQDEIARAILQFAARGGEPEEIDAAHLPAVLEGLAQAKRPVRQRCRGRSRLSPPRRMKLRFTPRTLRALDGAKDFLASWDCRFGDLLETIFDCQLRNRGAQKSTLSLSIVRNAWLTWSR